MSEQSNPGEPLEPQPNEAEGAPSEQYKVGPGRPPVDKRWQKGGPSPNPRGRPRKDRATVDPKTLFDQAFNKKVPVSRGGRRISMTRPQLGFEQLFNQFAKGDRHAWRTILETAKTFGVDFLAGYRLAIEEALTPNHQAILDAYVARRTGPDVAAAAPRVLAPSDLLDDDAAEAEPTAASPPSPQLKPANQQTVAQKLDQASLGRGRPPPGGYSVTTGKPT